MSTSKEEFQKWLSGREDTRLEFKKAERNFSFENANGVCDYCAALANEEGGKLILGVKDESHEVLETQAFLENWNTLSHKIQQHLNIRVDTEEFFYEGKRVLIFHVPKHFPGQPIMYNGKYRMRLGESLVDMDAQTLKNIFAEVEPDFSSEIVPQFSLEDIDEGAFEQMKKLWAQKAQRKEYLAFSKEKALRSLGLFSDEGLNYAALILLGKKEKIDALLPDSEIIFEWRNDPKKTAHDFRTSWRKPIFAVYNDIWEAINARNIRFPFQEGFVQREVYAFREKVIREALLNAITHRDYRVKGKSVFIKASPKAFFIESPGGFVQGVNLENILTTSAWRNRRIAEVLEKTDLVERSGQGMDDIFEMTIRDGKGIPDLSKTDLYAVRISIPAELKDAHFVKYLERIVNEKQIHLSFEELYELEKMRENEYIQSPIHKKPLLEKGLIEFVGKGRGTKYILAQKYYEHDGNLGRHTYIAGIPRERDKEFILEHLKQKGASRKKDLKGIFSDKNEVYIQNLLQELKKEKKIQNIGKKGVKSLWKKIE
jgi:ATP-dependent DNA helicase RecG